MVEQIAILQGEVEAVFRCHPDAEILLSQPGLGVVLAARVLGEFGDDPDRYADARARKNYSGMSPITRASGTKRVVLARYARNKRLADALAQQAFAALSNSPGARACYNTHRANGDSHHKALRALATASSASSTAACATEPSTTRPPPGKAEATPTASPLDTLEPWDVYGLRVRTIGPLRRFRPHGRRREDARAESVVSPITHGQ